MVFPEQTAQVSRVEASQHGQERELKKFTGVTWQKPRLMSGLPVTSTSYLEVCDHFPQRKYFLAPLKGENKQK